LGNTNDEWIKLHQKTVQRRAIVNKAMTIWTPKNKRNSLGRLVATIKLLRSDII